jgi:hypothetical protein
LEDDIVGETWGWLAIRVDPLERGSAENAELSSQMDSREFGFNERAVGYRVRMGVMIETE